MTEASREFQVFVKPVGAVCNLNCTYCYYSGKADHSGRGHSFLMGNDVLERYISQHIHASPGSTIRFSWHGGEPTLMGLDYFRKIVALQRRYLPPGRTVENGIQTNGTLIDEEWCRLLAAEGFRVGVSLDGPREFHDRYRLGKRQEPTHERAVGGYRLLRRYDIPCDVLCVVHGDNVVHPLQVYRFFRDLGVDYIGFLPLVERGSGGTVSERTPPALAFGDFLCSIFDEWLSGDIGKIRVQIFEESIGTGLGQEHALCVFRETCGDVPVVEHNGDFFPCDHFVDAGHCVGNINETPLVELLESPSQRAFGHAKRDNLPRYCKTCASLSMCNGGCPKDRFLETPDGEPGLNYLCAGYKRFFAHCRPFVSQVAALSLRQSVPDRPSARSIPVKPGRNDPCPCGSGRKYKRCCGR